MEREDKTESRAGGGSRLRRVIKTVLVAASALFVILVVSAYVFLQSRYPASFIRYAFRRAAGMELYMEGLTMGPWLRVSIKGLRVESGGGTLLRASRLDIKVSPSGGLDGRVLSLSLSNPVVFAGALGAGPGGSGSGAPALAIPWFLKSVEVRDALLYRGNAAVQGAGPLVGPLTLRIRALTGSRAAFQAEAYLPFLKTTASMGAELDMSAMGIHGGEVSLGVLRLEDLGAGGLPIVRHGRGTIRPVLHFQRKDGALTASFRGDFSDVRLPGLPLGGPANGRLTASVAFDRAMSGADIRCAVFLKERGSGRAAYRAAVLRGRYDIGKRDLEIKDAALTVPSIGAAHLRGAVHRVLAKDMAIEAELTIDDLALPVLNGPVFSPFAVEVLAGGRGLRGSASLRGLVSGGLDWGLDMRVESPVRYGPYVLDLGANAFRVRAEGVYSMGDDVLKIGALRAGLGRGGEVVLKGSLAGLRSGGQVLDLGIRAGGLDLRALRGAISGPVMPGLSIEGRAAAAVFLRGPLTGLSLHGGATLSALGLEGRGISLGRGRVSLEARLERGRLEIERIGGSAASFEMRAQARLGRAAAGGAEGPSGGAAPAAPASRLLGLKFTADRAAYAGGVFSLEALRLSAEKGLERGLLTGAAPGFEGAELTLRSARYEGGRIRAKGLEAKIEKAVLGPGAPGAEEKAWGTEGSTKKTKKTKKTERGKKAAAPGGAPFPQILNTSLVLRSLSYGPEGMGARGLELSMEKAGFAGPVRGAGRRSAKDNALLPRLVGTGLFVDALDLRGGRLGTRGVRIRVKKALLMKGAKAVASEEGIRISGAFEGDIDKKELRAEKLVFSMGRGRGAGRPTSGLGIKGEARGISVSFAGPLRARGSVEINDLEASELAPLLPGLGSSGAAVSGLLGARAAVEVVSGPVETRLKARLGATLRQGAFSSADGGLAAEGLEVKAGGGVRLSMPAMKADFSMNTEARGFELLAGSFYGSFRERPVKVSVRGGYDGKKDELSISGLTLAMEPVGRLALSGVVSGSLGAEPRLDLLLGPLEISNGAAFDFFIRDTFKETMPALAALKVDGRTGLRLRLKGTAKGLEARGELSLRRGAVMERDGSGFVREIDLTLPIDLVYPPGAGAALLPVRDNGEGAAAAARKKDSPSIPAAPSGVENRAEAAGPGGRRGRSRASTEARALAPGSLHVGEVSWAGVRAWGIKARPYVLDNELRFDGDVLIPVFGGTVTLGDIVYSGLLGPSPELSLFMDMEGLDLKAASAALGLPPFDGEVSGSIPGIKLSGGDLTTDGEIRLRLFGGEVTLTHMALGEVFSPVPSFRTNVEIKDLDLGALTGAFEFGTITGVLEGSVRDLVVVRGQPESFFVDIKTVPRRGVAQRISTKALENVSILGTGAAASVLNRGIYRLFDEYRYSKMGFQAQLKNDELILLGIETQGDKGYIIKGAKFPPKVDVVSHTERISFREMMRRLERVGFLGEEAAE